MKMKHCNCAAAPCRNRLAILGPSIIEHKTFLLEPRIIVIEKCKLKSVEFHFTTYNHTCTNDLKNETNSKSFKN